MSYTGHMRTMILIAAVIASATAALAQPQTEFLTKDPEFKPLFNDTDLTGWTQVNCAPSTFSVKDSEIVCSGIPTGVLRTDKAYTNYILELEWRHMKPGSNAGLFIWSDPLPARGQPFTRAVEVQIMDGMQGDGFTSDGDIFPIHGAHLTPRTGPNAGKPDAYALPTGKFMKPSPEWNHYKVTCMEGAVTL